MEFLGPLFKLMQERPELLIIALPLVMWYTERKERIEQQGINKGLIDKLLELTDNTVEKLTETNTLLQVLVRGKK